MAFFGIGGSNKKTNVSEGVVHDSKQETDTQSQDILAEFEAQFSNQTPSTSDGAVRPIPETVHSQPTSEAPADDLPDFDFDFHPSEPERESARSEEPAGMPRPPISVPEPERPRHEPVPETRPEPRAPMPPPPPPPLPRSDPIRSEPPRTEPPHVPPMERTQSRPPTRPRPSSDSLPDFDLPDFTSRFDERPEQHAQREPREPEEPRERWDFAEAFAQPMRAVLRGFEHEPQRTPPRIERSPEPERTSPPQRPKEPILTEPNAPEPISLNREPIRREPTRAPPTIGYTIPRAPEPILPPTPPRVREEPLRVREERHYDIVLRDGALFIEKNELARHLTDLSALRTISSSTKHAFDEIDTLAKDEKKLFTKMQTIVRSLTDSLEASDTLLFSGDQ